MTNILGQVILFNNQRSGHVPESERLLPIIFRLSISSGLFWLFLHVKLRYGKGT